MSDPIEKLNADIRHDEALPGHHIPVATVTIPKARLERLEKVAEAAKDYERMCIGKVDVRPGCDCATCCFVAALNALEETDES